MMPALYTLPFGKSTLEAAGFPQPCFAARLTAWEHQKISLAFSWQVCYNKKVPDGQG